MDTPTGYLVAYGDTNPLWDDTSCFHRRYVAAFSRLTIYPLGPK
jgi:hypothetical protein